MSDLISRADAIEEISRSSMYAWSLEQDTVAHNWALRIIQSLPSADRPHGKNISENGFLCSVCSFGDFGGFHGYEPNYCPNCGAYMGGKE